MLSQNSDIKWGKFSPEEIGLQECVFDNNASALIIFSNGVAYVTNNGTVMIDKYFRVKILKEEGLKFSEISIPYISENERVKNIKAHTVNIKNSGINTIDLDKSGIEDVIIDEDFNEIRFKLPQVEVGSFIEYKYTQVIKDPVLFLAWEFQKDIPVLKSRFDISKGKNCDMTYNIYYQGDRIANDYETKEVDNWTLKNIQAADYEPYQVSVKRFAESVYMQLERVSSFYASSSISSSVEFDPLWSEFVTKYLEYYSKYYPVDFAAKEICKGIITGNVADILQMKYIYDFVRANYDWNNNISKYVNESTTNLLKTNYLNSAEINLLLFSLLKAAGLNPKLVLINSKNCRPLYETAPADYFFDHLIVMCETIDERFFLDATGKNKPFDLPNEVTINSVGLVLDPVNPEFIRIEEPAGSNELLSLSINFTDTSKVSYKLGITSDGYFAAGKMDLDKSGLEYINSDIYSIQFSDNYFIDSTFSNSLENIDDVADFNCYFHFASNPLYNDNMEDILDFINFERIFTDDERTSPVDLGYKYKITYNVSILLPDGFHPSDQPLNVYELLFANSGKFAYNFDFSDNIITIRSVIEINEILYSADDYNDIKYFFDKIAESLNYNINLEKNE